MLSNRRSCRRDAALPLAKGSEYDHWSQRICALVHNAQGRGSFLLWHRIYAGWTWDVSPGHLTWLYLFISVRHSLTPCASTFLAEKVIALKQFPPIISDCGQRRTTHFSQRPPVWDLLSIKYQFMRLWDPVRSSFQYWKMYKVDPSLQNFLFPTTEKHWEELWYQRRVDSDFVNYPEFLILNSAWVLQKLILQEKEGSRSLRRGRRQQRKV